jgi:hypothetical protein
MLTKKIMRALAPIAAVAGIIGTVFTVLEYTNASGSQANSSNQTIIMTTGEREPHADKKMPKMGIATI